MEQIYEYVANLTSIDPARAPRLLIDRCSRIYNYTVSQLGLLRAVIHPRTPSQQLAPTTLLPPPPPQHHSHNTAHITTRTLPSTTVSTCGRRRRDVPASEYYATMKRAAPTGVDTSAPAADATPMPSDVPTPTAAPTPTAGPTPTAIPTPTAVIVEDSRNEGHSTDGETGSGHGAATAAVAAAPQGNNDGSPGSVAPTPGGFVVAAAPATAPTAATVTDEVNTTPPPGDSRRQEVSLSAVLAGQAEIKSQLAALAQQITTAATGSAGSAAMPSVPRPSPQAGSPVGVTLPATTPLISSSSPADMSVSPPEKLNIPGAWPPPRWSAIV